MALFLAFLLTWTCFLSERPLLESSQWLVSGSHLTAAWHKALHGFSLPARLPTRENKTNHLNLEHCGSVHRWPVGVSVWFSHQLWRRGCWLLGCSENNETRPRDSLTWERLIKLFRWRCAVFWMRRNVWTNMPSDLFYRCLFVVFLSLQAVVGGAVHSRWCWKLVALRLWRT